MVNGFRQIALCREQYLFKPVVTFVQFDELLANDLVQALSVWRSGPEAIVDRHQRNCFLGGRIGHNMQMAGIRRMHKVRGYLAPGPVVDVVSLARDEMGLMALTT